MSRAGIALFILTVVTGAMLFGIADNDDITEVMQQAQGATDWLQCKVTGGTPEFRPVKDNAYAVACENGLIK